MSSVYVLEPPTKGKVIINTTYGPIDVELWPKEAPKAVRNFVQLCLEGYYDDTVFHRIIKGFMVQGGDPTGTGTGGESIYGGHFADEFHSRLRFNHRGLVACANAGTQHSNGSQFFFTLDKCDWLDKKHTIFGKVSGESIYNLLQLGEVETGQGDRPLDPAPKIKSVEVLWNPFEDIVPRVWAKPLVQSSTDTENKDIAKKAVKKLNLLSFGEEAEEEENELVTVKQKIKSSHDVLDDPRLLKEQQNKELSQSELKATRGRQLFVREALSSKKEDPQFGELPDSHDHSDEDEVDFDARMRLQILRKRNELGDAVKRKPQNGSKSSKDRKDSAPRPKEESSDDEKRRVEKLSLKKKGLGSEARAERIVNADTELQMVGGAERERLLQKQKKRRLHGREDDILARLEKFKSSLTTGRPTSSNGSVAGDDEDLSNWKTATLKFKSELGKNGMSRKDDPNDYVVVDPLLEKGKEKFNRMQAKQKRREREWAGKSLT